MLTFFEKSYFTFDFIIARVNWRDFIIECHLKPTRKLGRTRTAQGIETTEFNPKSGADSIQSLRVRDLEMMLNLKIQQCRSGRIDRVLSCLEETLS